MLDPLQRLFQKLSQGRACGHCGLHQEQDGVIMTHSKSKPMLSCEEISPEQIQNWRRHSAHPTVN